MAEVVPSLLLTQTMSDIVFHVGGTAKPSRFPAHRFLLAVSSPVLKRMFESDFKEKRDSEVYLPDVDPDAFKSFLSFIYTKKILHQSSSELFDVLYIAHKYMVTGSIYQQCIELLTTTVNQDNFYKVHKAMELFCLKSKPNGGKLLRRLWEVLSENSEGILQYTDFARLGVEEVRDIISRDNLNVLSEKTIFEAVLKWVEQQCFEENLPMTMKNKINFAGPLLSFVRFSHITMEEFQKVLAGCTSTTTDDFLTCEEYLKDASGIDWYSLEGKDQQPRRKPEYLMRSLNLQTPFSYNSSNDITSLIASSQDLVLTELEFIPNPVLANSTVLISIVTLQNDTLWQGNCPLPYVELKRMSQGWIARDKKCCVPVDDVYMEAKKTYKIIISVKVGGLFSANRNGTAGMQEMIMNGKLFRIVSKVHYGKKNVLQGDVEIDGEWSGLLSKLQEMELDSENNNCTFGVIHNFTFLV